MKIPPSGDRSQWQDHQPNPVSDQSVAHNQRKYTSQPDVTPVTPSPHSQASPAATALTDRTTAPIRVKKGWGVALLVKVVSPVVQRMMSSEASRASDQMRDRKKKLKADLDKTRSRIKSCSKQLEALDKKLKKARLAVDKGKAQSQDQLLALLDEKKQLHEQMAELEGTLPWQEFQLDDLEQRQETLEQQVKKSRELAVMALDAGAEMASGLRQIYKHKQKNKNHNRPYELQFDRLHMTQKGRYELGAKDARLVLDNFSKNTDGSLTLSISEYTATCTSSDNRGISTPPTTVAVAFQVRLKKPLSDYLHTLMTCDLKDIPGKVISFHKEFNKILATRTSEEDKPPELMDFIDFEVGHVSIGHETSADLLSRAGLEPLLQLLHPVIADYKNGFDDAAMQTRNQSLHEIRKSTSKHNATVSHTQTLIQALQEEQQHLPDTPQMHRLKQALLTRQEALQTELDSAKKELERYQGTVEQLSKLNEIQTRKFASGRNDWVEASSNIGNLLMTLREACQTATPDHPVKLRCQPQRLSFGTTTDLDIDQLQADISSVHLDDNGVLTVDIPRLSTHITFSHGLEGPVNKMPVNLYGARLKLNPPLGKLVNDVLKLKFPLQVKTIMDLSQQIRALLSGIDDESAAPTKLVQLSLTDASLQTPEGERFCNDTSTVDCQDLAQSLTQTFGATISDDQITKTLGKLVAPDSHEHKAILHLLAMGLLGMEGEARTMVPLPQHSLTSPTPTSSAHTQTTTSSAIDLTIQETPVNMEETIIEPLHKVIPDEIPDDTTHIDTPSLSLSPEPPESVEASTVSVIPQQDKSEPLEYSDTTHELPHSQALEALPEPESDTVSDSTPFVPLETLNGFQTFNPLPDANARQTRVTGMGQESVALEMDSSASSVFGKMPWYTRWLLGSKDLKFEVKVARSERGVELSHPEVRVKKASRLRRFLANRLLKKRTAWLAIDHTGLQTLRLVADVPSGSKR